MTQPRTHSLADATKLGDEPRRSVILATIRARVVNEKGFRVLGADEVPAAVRAIFPEGTFYEGCLSTPEQERAILFLSPQGHYVVAVRTPEYPVGTVRRLYMDKLRDTFGYPTDLVGGHAPELITYAKSLARWVQGKIK